MTRTEPGTRFRGQLLIQAARGLLLGALLWALAASAPNRAQEPKKATSAPVALRESADAASPLKAMLEPGVLGVVKRCSGRWCRFRGDGFDGWIEQERLWGVYPNERLE